MALALFARCPPLAPEGARGVTRHFVKFGLTGLGRPPRADRTSARPSNQTATRWYSTGLLSRSI